MNTGDFFQITSRSVRSPPPGTIFRFQSLRKFPHVLDKRMQSLPETVGLIHEQLTREQVPFATAENL